MADATATFAIELDASGAAGAAKSTAGALQQLQNKIKDDVAALREMQAAMRRLQSGSSVNVEAFRQLKDNISAQKATIAASQERYLKLGGTFQKLKTDTKGAQAGTTDWLRQMQAAGGPAGSLAGRVSGLATNLQSLSAAGLLTAAALAAVAAASVVAYAALAKYGLAQADAYRSEALRLEGLTKLRRGYMAVAGSASHLQSSIDRVSATAAIGRTEVAGYAQSLYTMGLRGKNLDAALEATVIKASTQGKRWAGVFMGMAAGANQLGQSVEAMSNDVKARLGGIAEKQALSFSVQMGKLKESVAGLFKNLKIEPFLKGLNSILKLFSETTSTGKAIKVLMETMLNPFFASAEGGAPIAKRFIQGLVIGALTLAIVFYKVRNALRDAFGDTKFLSGVNKAQLALKLGMGAAALLVTVLGFLAAKLAIVAAGAAAAAAPFVALAGVIAVSFGYIISSIGELRKDWDLLKKAPWGDLAKAMLMGIVDGIKIGATWVIDAIKSLGKGMLEAFKGVLKIGSPSVVMRVQGQFVGLGAAEGIEASIPVVQRATVKLGKAVEFPAGPAAPAGPAERTPAGAVPAPVAAPVTAAPGPRRPAAGAAPGGPLVNIGELHVHSHAKDVSGVAQDVRREIERIFEGVAVQLGAVVTTD